MSETLIQPTTAYMMVCKTSELLDAMKFLSRAVPKNKKGRLYNCEITVKTNEVNFVAIGATMVLYCKSAGPVRISIPFLYFLDIVKNIKTFNAEISIVEGKMTIGNLTLMVSTCFFKDDTILRSINLPINYSTADILRLRDKYTPEEIAFNKLDGLINSTLAEINKDVKMVAGTLFKYGITKEEITKMVTEKIFNKQLKSN